MGESEKLTTKAFGGFEIKDAEKGEVEAIVATLGVVDRDGDILRKGAIPDGVAVKMSAWGHDAVFGNRPIGKGVISIDGNKAVFKGRVFLNTTEGRETFEVLKEMGRDQEWSWGFRVIGSEVPSDEEKKQGAWRILTKTDPFEVSPVIMGAGIGTRTLGVKSAEPQADGADGFDVHRALVDEVVTAIKAKVDAEIMEAKRIAEEAETKAAEDAKAEAERIAAEERARIAELATKEFERLQRNLRQNRIA